MLARIMVFSLLMLQAMIAAAHSTALVWGVLNKRGEKTFITSEIAPIIIKNLTEQAKAQQIEIVTPLYDLEDYNSISEEEVWAVEPKIMLAAKRYNPNYVLVIKIDHELEGNLYKVDAILLQQPENKVWQSSSANLDIAIADGFSNILPELKARVTLLAIPENANELKDTKLIVSGIMNVEQYAKVLQKLQQLNGVTEVDVEQITPEQTIFNLKTSGVGNLITALRMEHFLQEKEIIDLNSLHYILEGQI